MSANPGSAGPHALDARSVALTDRPRHPVRQARRGSLRAVVEERREQQLAVLEAVSSKPGHDVQPVALVGPVHRVEEGCLGRRQPGVELSSLGR